jgi:hypothetical protein
MTEKPRDRIRRKGELIIAWLVLVAIVAGTWGLVQAVGGFELAKAQAQARAAEAQARRLEAAADLEEQRQQTVAMLPGTAAALADTALATSYAIADRLLVLVLGALLGLQLTKKGGD